MGLKVNERLRIRVILQPCRVLYSQITLPNIIIIVDPLSSWRTGPLILLLQATLSLAATSAALHDLNPRCPLCPLFLFTVLRHVALGCPLPRLPSSAHDSASKQKIH